VRSAFPSLLNAPFLNQGVRRSEYLEAAGDRRFRVADAVPCIRKSLLYAHDYFLRSKELYDAGGEAALQELNRRQPLLTNRGAPKIEATVGALALEQPAWGQVRVTNELAKLGLSISQAGVRGDWQRHALETMSKRLGALEAKVALEGVLLTEAQLAALEKAQADKEAHGEFESECPGYCGAQDTFYVGTLTGVGRIYQQTFIDTYSQVAFAKLYDRKTPLTAADLLTAQVVPFFDSHEIPLSRVLTDRGAEYCGSPERHEYELYLAMENIDHTRTKGKSPQTNGICERFHKTMLNECYRVAFRKKIYPSLEELQADLELWLREYHEEPAAPRPVVLWSDSDADVPGYSPAREGEVVGSIGSDIRINLTARTKITVCQIKS
jgi:transposase InsO family protein